MEGFYSKHFNLILMHILLFDFGIVTWEVAGVEGENKRCCGRGRVMWLVSERGHTIKCINRA